MDNMFINNWIETTVKRLELMNPDLTEAEIREVVNEDIRDNFDDPNVILYNDYNDDTTLQLPMSTLYAYCKTNKPILGGNGTLFYNQNISYSPVADLISDRIATRTMYKGKMKGALKELSNHEEVTDDWNRINSEYEYYDMMQNEAKIRINSIYGSFGATTFQLYNKFTAASTTGTAQSLISATGISFEAILGDNVKFKSLDECIAFVCNILDEEYSFDMVGITMITDYRMVIDRLIDNFDKDVYDPDNHDESILSLIGHLSSYELTKIYYKNNIYQFTLCPVVKNLTIQILNKLESFDNPNNVPDIISEDIEQLWEYYREFVFYNHAYTERINRLKNDNRAVVKLIDTDSNLVYVQIWVDFVTENIVPLTTTEMTGQSLDFAIINTVTYIITHMLKDLLEKYCTDANVLPEHHAKINMKNELCFRVLLLAMTKKRYIGNLVLREGMRIDKLEVKGHDFKKAGVTEYVNKSITDLIQKRIIDVAPDIDLPGIYRDLSGMENDIKESLHNGERNFLMRMNCKDPIAYSNPFSMGQVLSVIAWNFIYPEKEIQLPDKLDVVLVDIPKPEKVDIIKNSYPEEWKRLKLLFEYQVGGEKIFMDKGIKYIAIPNNIDGIPEFIRPFIDIEYVKSRNLGTFKPVLDALGGEFVGSRQRRHFSNIRSLSDIEL